MTQLENEILRSSHTAMMEKASAMTSLVAMGLAQTGPQARILDSIFGALVQLLWRTLAFTEQQGVEWLHYPQLVDVGYQPVQLSSCAGFASIAFWAQRLQ